MAVVIVPLNAAAETVPLALMEFAEILLATDKLVKVPNVVILGCAAVDKVPEIVLAFN